MDTGMMVRFFCVHLSPLCIVLCLLGMRTERKESVPLRPAQGKFCAQDLSIPGAESPNPPFVDPNWYPSLGAYESPACAVIPDAMLNVKAFGAAGDGASDDSAAIANAIEAAQDGDVIYFPPGTYSIATPLDPGRKSLRFVGSLRSGSKLLCHSSNAEAIFAYSVMDNCHFERLAFDCRNHQAYAFRSGDLSAYTLRYCSWRQCEFYADFHTAIYGNAFGCVVEDCVFGYRGNPGAVGRAVYFGTTNRLKTVNNNYFVRSRFYQTVGETAAVEIATGWVVTFRECIFELMHSRAVCATGVQSVLLDTCWFEHIAPGEGEGAILLRLDTHVVQGSRAYLFNCMFQNNGSPKWDSIAEVGPACAVTLNHCTGNVAGYITKSGVDHDGRIAALIHNRFFNYSGALQAEGVVFPQVPDPDEVQRAMDERDADASRLRGWVREVPGRRDRM